MKIGLLTFHSQLNYGGVLQCWALRTALEQMGHEVVVIDRIFLNQVRSVHAVFKGWSFKQFVRWIVQCLLKRKFALMTLREVRTVLFVKKHLPLTDYSFKLWSEAPLELGVDLIVVGSDQVWNGTWQDPGPYLLEGAPALPAIGYGISLGMTSLPEMYRGKYRAVHEHFSSVSVREQASVDILQSVGISAACVADPVLLVDWSRYRKEKCAGLCCYFLSAENVSNNALELIDEYSSKTGESVSLFVHGAAYWVEVKTKRAKVKYDAGPIEFLKAISSARYVISDSFHALMFSSIFKKDVRIIRPTVDNEIRAAMFARIDEFVKKYVQGPCVVGSVKEALHSLQSEGLSWRSDAVEELADESRNWLNEHINGVKVLNEGNVRRGDL